MKGTYIVALCRIKVVWFVKKLRVLSLELGILARSDPERAPTRLPPAVLHLGIGSPLIAQPAGFNGFLCA